MKSKSFIKDLYTLIPLVLSGILCISLIFLLYQKSNTNTGFQEILQEHITLFISISGFTAAIIMVYLASLAVNLKSSRSSAIEALSKVTEKMHLFREIIEILLRSKIWLPGLKEYIDEEFEGLTFFDVKEFYKGKSKLAIEFLQENNQFEDTDNLYLELKALLMTHPKQKQLTEVIRYPNVYDQEIVSKWIEHKCGSGLWYYFGYKYGDFKEALDFNKVYERHQDKIMTLANTLDHEAFQDSSFNEVFLAKLGEYVSKEVIPKLFQFHDRTARQMPLMVVYLYGIFLSLVLFGVLLPIAHLLFSLPILILIIAISIVCSVIFFIATSFYNFISRESHS